MLCKYAFFFFAGDEEVGSLNKKILFKVTEYSYITFSHKSHNNSLCFVKKKKRTAVLVKKIYLYNNLCKGLFFSFFESVMFFFLTSGSCRLEGKNILQSPFLVAHTPATKDSNSRSVLALPHMSLFPGTQKTYRIVCAC